jgi:hypothetical protein
MRLYKNKEISKTMGNLLKTDGTIVKGIQPLNGTNYHLQQLYSLLKCQTIEVVHLKPGVIMVIDEEGKDVKDPNFGATLVALQHQAIFPCDYIAGDALIIADKELQ